MNFAHLAAQLRAMRLRADLKQTELAKLSGVCAQTISHYECGLRTHVIKLSHLYALAAACGLTIAEVLAIEPTNDELPFEAPPRVAVIAPRPYRPSRHDPLAGLLSREDSRFPSLQSSLGGGR